MAVLNLDMTGRPTGDSVMVDGAGDVTIPTRPTWVAAAHLELRLTVVEDGTVADPESDHRPFVLQVVPSLFVHTGSRDQPTVESLSATDAELVARISRLMYYVGQDIANERRKPQWTHEGRQHWLQLGERS